MMRGGNMQNMMKKMKKMQKEMEQTQQKLDETEFIGKASGGVVQAVFTGDRTFQSVEIDSELIDPEDPEMLQDLIVIAVNDALAQVDQETNEKMSKYTDSFNIPGMPNF